MNSKLRPHMVYVALSDDEFAELNPTDGRTIGNEIRHRIFGEERGRTKTGRPSQGRVKSISFTVSEEEFNAVTSFIPGYMPISKFIREIILNRMKNENAAYVKCECFGQCERRSKYIRVYLTPNEYNSIDAIAKKKCNSVAATARMLLFGKE